MWLWISLNPMSSDYAMNHILHINTVKMRMIVFKNNYTFLCQPLSRICTRYI